MRTKGGVTLLVIQRKKDENEAIKSNISRKIQNKPQDFQEDDAKHYSAKITPIQS